MKHDKSAELLIANRRVIMQRTSKLPTETTIFLNHIERESAVGSVCPEPYRRGLGQGFGSIEDGDE